MARNLADDFVLADADPCVDVIPKGEMKTSWKTSFVAGSCRVLLSMLEQGLLSLTCFMVFSTTSGVRLESPGLCSLSLVSFFGVVLLHTLRLLNGQAGRIDRAQRGMTRVL